MNPFLLLAFASMAADESARREPEPWPPRPPLTPEEAAAERAAHLRWCREQDAREEREERERVARRERVAAENAASASRLDAANAKRKRRAERNRRLNASP